MADCEICGKSNANKKAEIEGTVLTVCERCANLGVVKSSVSQKKTRTKKKRRKKSIPESDRKLKRDYSEIVKGAREEKELKREDLAGRINLKESILAKIERGNIKPSLDMARKLEKKLNIELVTEATESDESKKKKNSKSLTIGDVADIE